MPYKPMTKEAWILNLDTVPYEEAFALQERMVKLRSQGIINDTFILLEHPPVFTVTRKATLKNILVSRDELNEKGIALCKTNRGGDITYHGPGQIVGYPIMNLKDYGKDLHKYVRCIEEMIINHPYKVITEGKVSSIAPYRYLEHYELGDIVGIYSTRYGLQRLRVTEFIRSWEDGAESAYPTLSQIY